MGVVRSSSIRLEYLATEMTNSPDDWKTEEYRNYASKLKQYYTVYDDFPLPGIKFWDVFGLLQNAEAFNMLYTLLCMYTQHLKNKIDVVVGLDARGFLFGPILAKMLECTFVPIRKMGKLPGDNIKITFELEYNTETFEIRKNSVQPGQRVLIVDDVLATGGTMKAANSLVNQLGGEVVECLVIYKIPGLKSEMNSSKALASLTEFYTDSENEEGDNKDESSMELETDDSNPRDSDDELPPEPTGKCAPELQERVANLYRKVVNEGVDMNKVIQSRKDFRNPSIYEKLIDFCNINEYGTNYPPEVYDPLRWGKESYYDELAKVQKTEMDRREKERKEKTKVEIVSGMAKKPVLSSAGSGSSSSASASADKKRKTKWDQVATSSRPY